MSRLNLVVIGATILTCTVCYKAYEPNAYAVYVDGKSIAYVSEVGRVENISKDINASVKERFGSASTDIKLTYERITADKSAISTDEDLKKNMLSIMNKKVTAVEMTIDGKSVGVLANEKEGEALIASIAEEYLSRIHIDDKKFSGVKSNVKYIKRETLVSSVDTIKELKDKILKLNENKEQPFLVLEFTGKRMADISIDYDTTIKWTDSIKKGQSKVEAKGSKGIKRQEKQVAFINEKESSTKVIKETIIEKPKNEIVLKGTQGEDSTAAAMYVPSRGSISSNFGMRWGRMHEGIDIAAPTGTPIYAALDGKVTFAGWQSGYGYVIILSHKNSMETVYGHCSKIDVKVNENVEKGQVIGKVGSTGKSTGPHLHFEVKLNGKPQNPNPYIYSKQNQ